MDLRKMEHHDVDFVMRQKMREGWAASRTQCEVYLEHDPDGCFVAAEGPDPVGMVTTTLFGDIGWIGNLIVTPERRSRGIGRRLMEHGLARLRDRGTTTIFLEADPDGIPLYQSLGFADEFESCRFVRSTGSIGSTASIDSPVRHVAPWTEGMTREVAALDAAIVGADRHRLLALKWARAEVRMISHRDGGIAGFLLAAATDRGLRLGPCGARTPADAGRLIAAAQARAGDRRVLVGIPEPNRPGLELLDTLGFEAVASCRRMRLGRPLPGVDLSRQFAIASGAVG